MGGQAVALRIAGDQAAFYGCGFYGAQDTLHDDRGRHYFRECFIQGSIDFIFGNARSLFEVDFFLIQLYLVLVYKMHLIQTPTYIKNSIIFLARSIELYIWLK